MSEYLLFGLLSLLAVWRQRTGLGLAFLRVSGFWTILMLLAAFEEELLRMFFQLALVNAEAGLLLLGIFGVGKAPTGEPEGVGISPVR
jgi:hypothetical protein